MANSVQSSYQAYTKLDKTGKRQAVLALIEPLRDKHTTFATLFQYLTKVTNPDENILDDIYEIIAKQCSKVEDAQNAESQKKLERISTELSRMAEIEAKEREAEKQNAEGILHFM